MAKRRSVEFKDGQSDSIAAKHPIGTTLGVRQLEIYYSSFTLDLLMEKAVFF